VNTDKTDEEELRLVVEKASRNLKEANMELAEFSSYGNQCEGFVASSTCTSFIHHKKFMSILSSGFK